MKGVYIVIPAFNEARVIGHVIDNVLKAGFSSVIVVDDGSHDNTTDIATNHGALVFRHKINRGKGGATRTGIEAALSLGADFVVTMDGDGQHDPSEINQLIQPLLSNKFEVILGSRHIATKTMPAHKVLHNKIANGITKLYSGINVHDSQSGFRAYSRRACILLDTKTDSYEYESEVIRLIAKHKLSYAEVPITTLYTDYSTSKTHKQDISNGIRTVYKMIWNALS